MTIAVARSVAERHRLAIIILVSPVINACLNGDAERQKRALHARRMQALQARNAGGRVRLGTGAKKRVTRFVCLFLAISCKFVCAVVRVRETLVDGCRTTHVADGDGPVRDNDVIYQARSAEAITSTAAFFKNRMHHINALIFILFEHQAQWHRCVMNLKLDPQ